MSLDVTNPDHPLLDTVAIPGTLLTRRLRGDRPCCKASVPQGVTEQLQKDWPLPLLHLVVCPCLLRAENSVAGHHPTGA